MCFDISSAISLIIADFFSLALPARRHGEFICQSPRSSDFLEAVSIASERHSYSQGEDDTTRVRCDLRNCTRHHVQRPRAQLFDRGQQTPGCGHIQEPFSRPLFATDQILDSTVKFTLSISGYRRLTFLLTSLAVLIGLLSSATALRLQ